MSKKREMLVVASKVKDTVKAHKCQSSGDLAVALSEKVHEMIEAATARAKHNGRRTVRPYDL
jgi:histone H3/H4